LPLNFARLVGDLDAGLRRFQNCAHHLSWDCEDVAIFDLPGTRILLAWSAWPTQTTQGVLTLSVGPSPRTGLADLPPDHGALCAKLVERVQARVQPMAVLWHQTQGVMTAEGVDELLEALPDLATLSGPALPAPDNKTTVTQLHHSFASKPLGQDPDLARLRAALYGASPEMPSSQMRLAVHAMNATLIVVWLPLGAAAMAQGILRGEDIRLSSRLMVLTGSVAAFAQSPLGLQFAAYAQL
jgi:hypothetical protein